MRHHLTYLNQEYAIAREVRGFTDSEFRANAITLYLANNPLTDEEREEFGRRRTNAELEAKLDSIREYEADSSTFDLWAVLEMSGGVFRWKNFVFPKGRPGRLWNTSSPR